MYIPKKRILVVDDNDEILQMLNIVLSRSGYEVFSHSKPTVFLEAIQSVNPDIILLDMRLGWADGCALCTLVKTNQNFKHIKVVMFSAYHKAVGQCMSAGADRFVPKPFAIAELLEAISTVNAAGVNTSEI